jgi:hypothetical protein
VPGLASGKLEAKGKRSRVSARELLYCSQFHRDSLKASVADGQVGVSFRSFGGWLGWGVASWNRPRSAREEEKGEQTIHSRVEREE